MLCKRSQAEHMAAQVWRRMGLTLPVNVEIVAKGLGIRVHYRYIPEDEDFCGVWFRGKKYAHILINTALPDTRQKFTLAHEVGHHILSGLHMDECAAVSVCSDSSTCAEKWCDAYAAALLMPEWAIRSMATQLKLPEALTVYYLCAMFGVSKTAMWRRLRELGLCSKNKSYTEALEQFKRSSPRGKEISSPGRILPVR